MGGGVRRVGALLTALTAVALAACSPADQVPAPPASADAAEQAEPPVGPLEAYLGAAVVAGQTQAEFAAELAASEEAIAACMAEQGFEYVPVVMVPGSFETSDEPRRGTREFAEIYGYGIWHTPEIEPGQFTSMLDAGPNAAYRESLSPEAQEAYDVALMGRKTDLGDGSASYDGVGCMETPWLRESPEAEYLRGVQEEVSDYLQSLWDGDDPRLAEVDADWASCMRDAGYDDDSPHAAEWRVIDEVMAAYEVAPAGVPADAVSEAAAAERALALADQDCRDATDWTARRRAVEHQLQQEYVDDHRADLDALVAARDVTAVLD